MSFSRAVQILVDTQVEFAIIGGWAAILHGSSYLTNDLDLCYSRAPENLQRIAAALAPFHPRLREVPGDLPFVWDERTLANGTVFTLATDLGPIDLLAEVAGIGGFDQVVAKSISVPAFDRIVRALDLPALITRSAPRVVRRIFWFCRNSRACWTLRSRSERRSPYFPKYRFGVCPNSRRNIAMNALAPLYPSAAATLSTDSSAASRRSASSSF